VRAGMHLQEKERVNRCASCGREIPESATVCDTCQKWASDYSAPTPAATASAVMPQSSPIVTASASPAATESAVSPAASKASSSTTAATKKPGLTRRELTIMGAAIVGGGLIAVAVMATRSGSSTAVAASNVVPATRTSAPERASAPRRATQAWSTTRRGYWTANQRHAAAFELPAENTVPIWMNYVRPLLVVRCMGKKAETFVYTGSALKIEPETEDHTVTFRFDDESARSERWPDSAEHDALFAPDATAFAHRVMSAHTLRFGYTPHNAEPVEAVFEISGLTDLVTPSAKDCGWQK
jgi:hypothetical protein